MKKTLITIFVLLLLLGGVGLYYINTDTYKLKKLGYSDADVKNILTLDKNSISYLKNNYVDIINNLILDKGFKKENLERYYIFYKNNNITPNKIIYIVNNDFDQLENFVFSEVIFDLVEEKYFIKNNTVRYIDYYNKNNDLETKKVISYVNTNLDYDYYTNVINSDVGKENLVIVNKYNKLNSDFIPSNLVSVNSFYGRGYLKSEAYEAFKKMSDDADKENINLWINSGYRSFDYQKGLYDEYVLNDGFDKAETYSARPGYSEHQIGLAVDVGITKNGKTDYSWIIENCYKYGFILRYRNDSTNITGYMYEPWHYRYVGIEVANKIHDLNITYDEYYAYYLK